MSAYRFHSSRPHSGMPERPMDPSERWYRHGKVLPMQVDRPGLLARLMGKKS